MNGIGIGIISRIYIYDLWPNDIWQNNLPFIKFVVEITSVITKPCQWCLLPFDFFECKVGSGKRIQTFSIVIVWIVCEKTKHTFYFKFFSHQSTKIQMRDMNVWNWKRIKYQNSLGYKEWERMLPSSQAENNTSQDQRILSLNVHKSGADTDKDLQSDISITYFVVNCRNNF